ncbi:MAG: cob(I)yrinic acid a,c-diamide adenosyltransferase [Pseudomonadota bacterium]
MPDRLTKITTRGGDAGQTSLGDGSRVPKTDPRIGVIGDVDELNSWVGVVLAQSPGETVQTTLIGVQHDLFDLGGGLCFPDTQLLSEAHVKRLDDASSALNADLPPLKDFILPGGDPLIAWMHVARTTCRRVERALVQGFGGDQIATFALQYLNRLSDYLFIASRFEAKRLNVNETLWRKKFSVSGDGE